MSEWSERGGFLQLTFTCETPDEFRALYRMLLQARNTQRAEAERLRSLRANGYGTESDDSMRWRAEAMELMADRLIAQVGSEMMAEKIEPW